MGDNRPGERMRVSDVHPDMARYLHEDCYCPGEIYDVSGFGFYVFDDDLPCRLIARNDGTGMLAFVATPRSTPMAVIAWYDDPDGDNPEHRVVAAQMVDATENNIGILRDIVDGAAPDGRRIDAFDEQGDAEAMRRLLSVADAVIRD